MEGPADDDVVAVDDNGADTLRLNRLGSSENAPLVGNQGVAADSRRLLIFPHRSVAMIELFDRLGVGILLDACNETIQGFKSGHCHMIA